ncbi:MAG: precorrin-6y C5,15-methyltransferase (decarboxylating) subunit CbiE [Devosia sp.]|uniref:precorrin-6y C5,15-methyltransferase (decarboxylating) subunit CbiE n=1 Tax=Devosia sp. TaxID=1871048 RepID=UPI001AD34E50|nr:precorrin-6y C5,15-methyltransferase (decarboxylating) subunit CbiE [Devosia sp.]MBN9314851.1 precorrin-6y C5,15-methyltransferase (decarboxylating) subunit CbiE [Devosia sp.]
MTAWLHIIGVGERGPRELPASYKLLLGYADTVIGPARFLADLEPVSRPNATADLFNPEFVSKRSFEAVARALAGEEPDHSPAANYSDGRTLLEWEPPIDNMIEQVMALRDSPTVILASGDPMWFGIGATLTRHLLPGEFVIHPHPSAFQLAAARLHWPLQSVAAISLHARPVETLHPHLVPGNRILALTADRSTVDLALELLIDRGYGHSLITTLENLGSSEERITSGEAETFDSHDVEDFYVLAIDCVPDFTAPLLPPVPGLPDESFVNDGQLTKREVRAATLAKLAPFVGAVLWDVGAGSGSVAIEWLRAARDTRAVAFESAGARVQMIAANAASLGVPHLEIVQGRAPEAFGNRAPPDAIFMGGDVGNDDLFDACWGALKPGGRLVANAVTLDAEHALYSRHLQLGGELTRIEVAALDRVGGHRAFRPRMAVTQWVVSKAVHGFVVNP